MKSEAEIIAAFKAREKEKLRKRMSKLGKSRSPKKVAAARRTIELARAAKGKK